MVIASPMEVHRRVRPVRAPSGPLLLLLDSRAVGYRLRLIDPPRVGEELNWNSYMGTEYRPVRHPRMFGFQMHRKSFRDKMLGAIEADVHADRVLPWPKTMAPSTIALAIEIAADPRLPTPEEPILDDLSDLDDWWLPTHRQLRWFLPA